MSNTRQYDIALVGNTSETNGYYLKKKLAHLGIENVVYCASLQGINAKVAVTFGEQFFLETVPNIIKPKRKSLLGVYHCYPFTSHNGIPVIPTFSVSYVQKNLEISPFLTLALKKAKSLVDGRVDAPRRVEVLREVGGVGWVEKEIASASVVSIDIEVFKYEMACIAFSIIGKDKKECVSYVYPLSVAGGSYWDREEDEVCIWQSIARILSNPGNSKLFQNFIFDCMWLSHWGFEIKGEILDTMLAASFLHPELPKGLADLGRIYTLAPAWKLDTDWSKMPDSEELYKYNGLDAALTLEIHYLQERQMVDRGIHDIYDDKINSLIQPVFAACTKGFRVDTHALSLLSGKMKESTEHLLFELDLMAQEFLIEGFNPNSHKQVKDFLSKMGLRIPTVKGKETTGKLALLKLARRHPDVKLLPKLMQYKKAAKLQSTYTKVRIDDDGRLRYSINIGGTKSGRFSSSQTPWGTGLNCQNVPSRDPEDPFNFRHIIIPDEGMDLIQVDLAQAEARVVSWLAREEGMERIFDEGGDIHTKTASLVFGEDISTLPPEERKRKRYLGKKCVHAFNYGMAEGTFADTCLLESGMSLSLAEAKTLKTSYFRAFPNILRWHREIENKLRRTRRLESPTGRSRAFHGHMDDRLYREAYSYIPQCVVVDYLNEGWVKLYGEGMEVLQQGHDSLLIQVKKSDVVYAVKKISEVYSGIEVTVNNRVRQIPYDIAVGPNWKDLVEV